MPTRWRTPEGLRPGRNLQVARTVLLELERVYNHLHDIGAICAGVGFARRPARAAARRPGGRWIGPRRRPVRRDRCRACRKCRGATACAVELSAGEVTRVHLRTSSYANWPALAHATAGSLIPDFPLINKSFELCYACVDR
jgi:Ni,Fe-hydrogenase III large subunit